MSNNVKRVLRESYDRKVDERDARDAPAYESQERDAFLSLLLAHDKRSVLDLGAATGTDAEHFKAHGLDPVCVDISPEMVLRCERKGLSAHVMDVGELSFADHTFDALYAMNCLVHVPKPELDRALNEMARVLKPGGLAYMGMYGGYDFEGTGEWDPYEPKRFFSFLTDEGLRARLEQAFRIRHFKRIPRGWAGLHFQSVTLESIA